MFEALEQLRFQAFYESLPSREQDEIVQMIADMRMKFSDADFSASMSSEALLELFKRYEKFVDASCCKDPTFSLWSSYISMTDMLLDLNRYTNRGANALTLSNESVCFQGF